MRNVHHIFFSLLLLSSCSNKFDTDRFPQEWELTSMFGQMPGSFVSGADMEWQESYILNPDGTFTKYRIRNGVETEGSGIFMFKDLDDGRYLELYYETSSEIIGSCTSGLKETLWLRSETRMSGTWSYCDGPGLEYERIK